MPKQIPLDPKFKELALKYFPQASDEEIQMYWEELQMKAPGVTIAQLEQFLPLFMEKFKEQAVPKGAPAGGAEDPRQAALMQMLGKSGG